MKKKMKRVLSFLLAVTLLLSSAPLASARISPDTQNAQAGIRLEQSKFDSGNGILEMKVLATGVGNYGIHSGRILFSVDPKVLTPYLASGKEPLQVSSDKGKTGGYGLKGESPIGSFSDAVGGSVTQPTSKIRVDESQSKYVVVSPEEGESGESPRTYLSYEFTLNTSADSGVEVEAGVLYFKVKNNDIGNLTDNSFRLGTADDIGYVEETRSYDEEKAIVSSTAAYTIAAIEYISTTVSGGSTKRNEVGYYYDVLPAVDANIGVNYNVPRQIRNIDVTTGQDISNDPERWNIGIYYTGWDVPAITHLYVGAQSITEEVPKAGQTKTTSIDYTGKIKGIDVKDRVRSFAPTDLYWEFCDAEGNPITNEEDMPKGVSFETEMVEKDGVQVEAYTGQLKITPEASQNEGEDLTVYFRASRNLVYMEEHVPAVDDRIGFRAYSVLSVALTKETSVPTSVAVQDEKGNSTGQIDISSVEPGSFQEKGLDLTVDVKDQYGYSIGAGTLFLSLSGEKSDAFILTPQDGATEDEDGLIAWNGTTPIKVKFSFGEDKTAADAQAGDMKIQATFHPAGIGDTSQDKQGFYTAALQKEESRFSSVELVRYTDASFANVEPSTELALPATINGIKIPRRTYYVAKLYDQYHQEMPAVTDPKAYQWSIVDEKGDVVQDENVEIWDSQEQGSTPYRNCLSITSSYAEKEIRLKVSVAIEGGAKDSDTAVLTITRGSSQFGHVRVKSTIYPDGTEEKPFQLKIATVDQYGADYIMTEEDLAKLQLKWEIDTSKEHNDPVPYQVTEDGLLTVYGNQHPEVHVKVTPTYNGKTEASDTGTLVWGGIRALDSIELAIDKTTYAVPEVSETGENGVLSVPVTAKFFDQYEEPWSLKDGETVVYKPERGQYDGVVLETGALNGEKTEQKLTFTVTSEAAKGKIDLTAETANVTGSRTVELTKNDSKVDRAEVVNEAVKSMGTTVLETKCYDQYGAQIPAARLKINWLKDVFDTVPPNRIDGYQYAKFDANVGSVTTYKGAELVRVQFEASLLNTPDETVSSELTALQVLDAGEAASVTVTTDDNTTVAIPEAKADGTPNYVSNLQFKAKVMDSSGLDIGSDTVVWDILGEHNGVSISKDGRVTVDSTAAVGTYTVVAIERNSGIFGTAKLFTVHESEPYLARVDIKESIILAERYVPLTPLYYDQYGNPYTLRAGETLEKNYSQLKDSGSTEWRYTNNVVTDTYSVQATAPDTYTLIRLVVESRLTGHTAEVIKKIYAIGEGNGTPSYLEISGPDTITLQPGQETYPVTTGDYQVYLRDQFGANLSLRNYVQKIKWEFSAPGMSGVELTTRDGSTSTTKQNQYGNLTLNQQVPEGTIRLTVTYYDRRGNITDLVGFKDVKVVHSAEGKNALGRAEITNGRLRPGTTTPLTARLYDSFGEELIDLDAAKLTWTLVSPPEGVEINNGNQILVPESVTEGSVTVSLTAEYGGSSKTVEKELAISAEESVLTDLEVRNVLGGLHMYIPPVGRDGLNAERLSVYRAIGYDQFGDSMGTPHK